MEIITPKSVESIVTSNDFLRMSIIIPVAIKDITKPVTAPFISLETHSK